MPSSWSLACRGRRCDRKSVCLLDMPASKFFNAQIRLAQAEQGNRSALPAATSGVPCIVPSKS